MISYVCMVSIATPTGQVVPFFCMACCCAIFFSGDFTVGIDRCDECILDSPKSPYLHRCPPLIGQYAAEDQHQKNAENLFKLIHDAGLFKNQRV